MSTQRLYPYRSTRHRKRKNRKKLYEEKRPETKGGGLQEYEKRRKSYVHRKFYNSYRNKEYEKRVNIIRERTKNRKKWDSVMALKKVEVLPDSTCNFACFCRAVRAWLRKNTLFYRKLVATVVSKYDKSSITRERDFIGVKSADEKKILSKNERLKCARFIFFHLLLRAIGDN